MDEMVSYHNIAGVLFQNKKHPQGQYTTDDLYMGIVQRKRVGCFQCPLVYGVVLVHLASPYAENLVYHPPHPRFIGRVDDVKQFAFSAQNEGLDNSLVDIDTL